MGLFKIAAAGTLGYFAYRSWQRRASAAAAIDNNAPAHAERPLVTNVSDDANRASHDDVSATTATSAH